MNSLESKATARTFKTWESLSRETYSKNNHSLSPSHSASFCISCKTSRRFPLPYPNSWCYFTQWQIWRRSLCCYWAHWMPFWNSWPSHLSAFDRWMFLSLCCFSVTVISISPETQCNVLADGGSNKNWISFQIYYARLETKRVIKLDCCKLKYAHLRPWLFLHSHFTWHLALVFVLLSD